MKPATELFHLESGLHRDSSLRARSASHPVVSVHDLPKLLTPYMAALPSPDRKREEEFVERYNLQRCVVLFSTCFASRRADNAAAS